MRYTTGTKDLCEPQSDRGYYSFVSDLDIIWVLLWKTDAVICVILMKWKMKLILLHIILFIQGLCLIRLRGKSVLAYGGLRRAAVTENETFGGYLEMAQELTFHF